MKLSLSRYYLLVLKIIISMNCLCNDSEVLDITFISQLKQQLGCHPQSHLLIRVGRFPTITRHTYAQWRVRQWNCLNGLVWCQRLSQDQQRCPRLFLPNIDSSPVIHSGQKLNSTCDLQQHEKLDIFDTKNSMRIYKGVCVALCGWQIFSSNFNGQAWCLFLTPRQNPTQAINCK